ncbi:EAL domain-containing protein [Simplicispira lacusdiani]|uniref:EAL domain-containing protein n=1 Tax=Simplicispira lacusdiani TaxID=2213010 RepID=UPI000E75CE5D|nr:EAL domain-containing protein [Simplicispira lacusdiani]
MEEPVHDPEETGQWSDGAGEPFAELPAIVELLRRRCAVDFSGYKVTTLSRRIRQRMVQPASDGAAYLQRLSEDEAERNALCSDLLINVTEFFRDPAVFAQLAEEVLPDLLRGRDAGDELRIWSAGCASGEEAYSLAMLALEAAGRMGFHGNVKVFATDLAGSVLEQASRGSFSPEAVAAVPDALLRRYFQRDPQGGARVDATLRRHVVFARHNLLSDPPFTRIDLAVCRNLLIYLKPAAQIKALSQLHFALKPQGALLLGASETVGEFEAHAFSVMDRSHKLFRKQLATLARTIDVPTLGARPVPAQPLLEQPDLEGQPPELLHAELLATRERLQEMVLELQASHERLDLSNEELTASNEELQSTNEELKTVNEDLYTLNRELEDRNGELAALNRDYDHLLASTEIGIVFLDSGLCLRRFSPAVADFLALRESDIGRPVSDIRYRIGPQEDFLADLRRCLGEGARIEREIALPGGRWVHQRMLPFKEGHLLGDGVVLTWTDISEVKRMQTLTEQLAADRTRLMGILDALPDGVYIVSPSYEIEYLNPVLEREFGPINGRKCFEYFHGRSSPCDWCKNQEVFAGQTVHWEWTSPKGRTYDLFDMPFRNPDGTVSKFEIFHDISDIKETRRRMEEAAQLAHVGHWEWVIASGELLWSNETFLCFGYEPGGIVPSFGLFIEHIDPQDRARVQSKVQQTLEQGGEYEAEFRFHRADGAARIGRATGHVTRDARGEPLAMSGAMQDITVLRQTEQRFQVAFRASPLAASIAQISNGLFLEVNDKYEKYFGWTRDDLIGRTTLEVGLWVDLASREAWLDELRRQGTSLDFESQWRCKSGEIRHVSLSAELIDIDNEPLVLAFIQDITERKENEARIDFLAHHDPLTGLPNRVLFRDRFELATAWSGRSGSKVGLMYLDLDHFKTINDSLGHPVGDQLLQQVARRLRQCVRDTDTISRQGGDEFLIALTDIDDLDAVGQVASKVVQVLSAPFEIEGHDLAATLSMGVAVWPDDGQDFNALLQRADTAMYQAKAAGRNTYRFYTAEMNTQALEQLKLRTALHWALDQQEFVLHYQPQIDLASGHVVGVEALLRWQRGPGELLLPGRFIAAAEESGLIVPMGEWVLREACAQAMRWQQAGLPELTMAVNLSAVQFRRGDLLQSVTQALVDSGLEPSRLELELTESLLLDDAEPVLETVRRFKSLGVCLSIDDFGTGYSSLAYLKRFAVDKLKIDQSFVRDIASDPDDAAIVRAIISMARSLKLKVIAEGVESAELASFLRLYHCHEAQGFHYARPMPADALAQWLIQYEASL